MELRLIQGLAVNFLKYCKNDKLIIGLVLLFIAGVLLQALFVNNKDTALHYELRGISHDISISALCNPNPLAGLEKNTSNTSSRRMTSLFYAIPTKLLYSTGIPVHLLHRGLSILTFMITLILLYTCCRRLGLHPVIGFGVMIYYGLSEQHILPLLAAQLTLMSITWFCLLTLLYFRFSEALREHNKTLALGLVIPLVALIISGYETYVVSRLLALALLAYLAFHIAVARYPFKLHLTATAFAAFCLSVGILKLCHWDMTFDMQLFRGDGESLINHSLAKALKAIMLRISELPLLFHMPVHSHLTTWYPPEKSTGWLEIWLLLGVLLPTFIFFLARGRLSLENVKPKLFELGFLLIASAASVAIPLGSYHQIRGHRFFVLYIATTILAGFFIHILSKHLGGKAKAVVYALVLLMAGATLIHRLPLILEFKQGRYTANEQVYKAIQQLQEIPIVELPESSNVLICNRGKPYSDNLQFIRPVAWTAALYVSRFACNSNISEITVDQPCDCIDEMKKPDQKSNACIDVADKKDLSVHYKEH